MLSINRESLYLILKNFLEVHALDISCPDMILKKWVLLSAHVVSFLLTYKLYYFIGLYFTSFVIYLVM